MLIALCLLSLTTLAQTPQPLIITTQSFPTAIAGRQYNVQLTATGGITPYHWRILEGKLPGGLQVSDSGLISGTPSEIGEFNVTLAVSDSSAPTNAVQKKFAIKSIAPMIVKWIESPQVRDQGIWGKVEVDNQTEKPFDLTVIILAVNDTGKAFALGYQHFTLTPQKQSPPIPFGATLPFGNYVVHLDAIAEVASINTIHRVHLQTTGKLTYKQP